MLSPLLLAFASCAALPQDTKSLLDTLRAADTVAHAAAAASLEALGPSALAALRDAREHTDDEAARARLDQVIGGIEVANLRGVLVAFTRGEALASDLYVWCDGAETRLTADKTMDYALALSPDGKRLAFARTPDHHDFGVHDVVVRELASGAERVIDKGHGAWWSPDGATLAIAAADGVALRSLADRTERRLGGALAGTRRVRWSPNGRFLAGEAGEDVVVVDAATGKEHKRIDGTPGSTRNLYSFSLGDSLVSMVSGNGPYQWDVYVAPLGDGETRKLTAKSFRHGITALSPTEDLVFCTQSVQRGYAPFVIDVAAASQREVAASASPLLEPTWSADGKFVVFVDGSDTIQLLHARSGRCRALAKMQVGYGPNAMAFAPAVWFANGRALPEVRAAAAAK